MRSLSYITVEEAIECITKTVRRRLSSEKISIDEAYGRILAENIVSDMNIPAHDISHMDGYAIVAADASSASKSHPVYLEVKGEIGLSDIPSCSLRRGENWKVLTGSALPENADAVVMKEMVTLENNRVVIRFPVVKGENIVPAGIDISKGDIIFVRGHIVRAQDIGLFEILNIDYVKVTRKPKVAILSVGDELVKKAERSGKAATSHAKVIARLVEKVGGVPKILGIAPDDASKIKSKIVEVLDETDILLTIGGASVGERDLVIDAINSIGKPGMIFHGIKIAPGRVSGFGILKGKPITVLPGLIQSTFIGFQILVKPLMQLITGSGIVDSLYLVKAEMEQSVRYKKFIPFKKVTFVKLSKANGKILAEPIIGDSSRFGVIVRADGFIIVPEQKVEMKKGENIEVNVFQFSS